MKHVFDLDNTLVYTNDLNNEAYNYALKNMNKNILSKYKRITREVVFQNENLTDIEKEKLISLKQEYFIQNLKKIQINSKLINFLKSLNPIDCILWTRADSKRVEAILKYLKIDKSFSWIFYSKKLDIKEDERKICKYFSCEKQDLIYYDDD